MRPRDAPAAADASASRAPPNGQPRSTASSSGSPRALRSSRRCGARAPVRAALTACPQTMEKLNGAGNLAQKEKYEAELKKIIKKLQRERDQIKTWLTSNDVKDKSVLTDQRRLIETQMEKFKAIERELKTKAYSREGLSAATKMDPQEKEKAELGNWISDSVDRLSAQVDKYEAEAEQLQAAAKKKRVDTAKAEKLSQLDRQVERHKHHMSNLEVILRMLENGQLSVDDVQSIKEDVDYYIESAEGGDFPEDDAFYDDLNLDETQYGHPAEGATDSEDEDAAPSPKELEKVASGPASAVGSPQRREEKKSALASGLARFLTWNSLILIHDSTVLFVVCVCVSFGDCSTGACAQATSGNRTTTTKGHGTRSRETCSTSCWTSTAAAIYGSGSRACRRACAAARSFDARAWLFCCGSRNRRCG